MSDHFDLTLPGARVTFSTRRGGVSEGPFSSLNLGLWTEDEADRVVENRRLLERHTNTAATALGGQMHGTELQEWSAPPSGADPPEVDGHLTRECGLGLLVLTADCLPVALASPDRVAMLHCGWRGLAGGIVGRALERFERAPAAAIGPGIGPCCFEVGEEVAATFGRSGETHLDLRAIAREQLQAEGVGQITEVDLCTSCHPELFFSHRRDRGVTGRQAGVVVRDGG
ncbi:MAG TPA: polyphenol oxidase family protein [Thermoleophilaceae bacterium]|nr:polyphenol oxidase family protein [Thermoleophilaceae bacterium]